jgi:hypothetical protein
MVPRTGEGNTLRRRRATLLLFSLAQNLASWALIFYVYLRE